MLKIVAVFLLTLGWMSSAFALIVTIPKNEIVVVGTTGSISVTCSQGTYQIPIQLFCEIPGLQTGESAIVSILHKGNSLGSFTLLGPGIHKIQLTLQHPAAVSNATYTPVILLSSARAANTALLCLTVHSTTTLCSITHT